MRAFETFRSELLAALREATRGYGCDSWERAVKALPRAGAPEWREDWLYAVSGHGGDGMIYQVEREIGRAGNTPRSARAWLRVHDLLVGLREELRTVPTVGSVAMVDAEPVKVGCECVSGCAECDGEGRYDVHEYESPTSGRSNVRASWSTDDISEARAKAVEYGRAVVIEWRGGKHHVVVVVRGGRVVHDVEAA